MDASWTQHLGLAVRSKLASPLEGWMLGTVTISTTKPCYDDGAAAATEEALGAGGRLRTVAHLLPHQHTQTGREPPPAHLLWWRSAWRRYMGMYSQRHHPGAAQLPQSSKILPINSIKECHSGCAITGGRVYLYRAHVAGRLKVCQRGGSLESDLHHHTKHVVSPSWFPLISQY